MENQHPAVPAKKVILLIDLDGVCADWYGQLYQELKLLFPNDEIPAINELTGYFWEDSFDEKYHTYIDAIVEAKGFYRKLVPYQSAIAALKDIQENCLDFINPWICTKPSSGYKDYLCHSEKIQWVAEHMGHFWAERTILTPDKTLVHGDFLIDDHPNIRGVNPSPGWGQLLYAQPYNADVPLTRVTWDDWEEMKRRFKQIAGDTNAHV